MSICMDACFSAEKQGGEVAKDQIVTRREELDGDASLIKIPNPKNFSEEYSFQFKSVYDQDATQQAIFEAEGKPISPTIKHLFQGYDVTLFAYGTTGSGKTHTMRGGKCLTERGMIPRLLSNIYRKSRAIEKSTAGSTTAAVSMSYYEIYNDRVYDLFEAPEKRTATGLPIREAEGGKTVVVGLSEIPCSSLKDFEGLYDRANANRSTGATKLNAHSSRSHAILCVKVTISTPSETRVSTVSAIDLAGSEDNRRTGNGKDRMVESASINKSLFVLAQCVEAISKKQPRIPYRESKMTRILSLGQNNGFTVMILNLAPTKAFHLDTLSSLNFANRTKKIEVREVENEPIFRGPPRQPAGAVALGQQLQRQPLRPLAYGVNANLTAHREQSKNEKPLKSFSVYSDRARALQSRSSQAGGNVQKSSPLKRAADDSLPPTSRPLKISRPTPSSLPKRGPPAPSVTKASIESIVEAKVSEILASRALNAPNPVPTKDVSVEVKKRLDEIEKRLEGQEGERAEGLSYLFMAKQHQARGEEGSALKMYELAKAYFPGNEKLERKIEKLKEKMQAKRESDPPTAAYQREDPKRGWQRVGDQDENDASYHDNGPEESEGEDEQSFRSKPRRPKAVRKMRASSPDPIATASASLNSPRTSHLLTVINTRDISQIRSLNGLGAKRAEGILDYLTEMDEKTAEVGGLYELSSWQDLVKLRGVGKKTLDGMREGVVV